MALYRVLWKSIATLRPQSWQLLRRLAGIHELNLLPWVIGGDFNEILYDSEKSGGIPRNVNNMMDFSDVVDDCGLQSLAFKGDLYTWCNRRRGDDLILARLDRFLCNMEWNLLFPDMEVMHLGYYGSDHRVVSLLLQPRILQVTKRSQQRFNFEHKWLLEEDFMGFFNQCWEEIRGNPNLPKALVRCSTDCKGWASRFDNLGRKIKNLRQELDEVMSLNVIKHNIHRIAQLEKEIEKLSDQEEIHWAQKSRVNWLKQGDRNTKFFHSRANTRCRTNFIKGLKNSRGEWCEEEQRMAVITSEYFANLFSSSNPTRMDIEAVTSAVDSIVDAQMNEFLCAPFNEEEIKRAVFDLHPSKAPGLDGFIALFFQKLWPIVGIYIIREVKYILNAKGDPTDWNSTLITLIPKVNEPTTLKDFRPISLCNTCYKIVARAITNRFRPIMAQIIDAFQSAFVPGRLIIDNVIVGFECMHWIRNNRKAKSGFAALKLDMSKAYDRVEWNFLEAMLTRLGFAENWINLIMRCVATVSYSFRINQSIYGNIHPTRGLRQGDPLSPYLFVICAQGLSHIITKAVERRLIGGVKVARSCPTISHLFFADDSLVFFKANKEDSLQVRNCLQKYEKASGQMINYEKSGLTFSPSTSSQSIKEIKDALKIPIVNSHEIYLGMPTFSLRKKRLQFDYLRERICKKTQGWNANLFSMGGREVLIKSVLQSIPSYAMSCFRLPVSLCRRIEQTCAKFWWNDKPGKRGLHWKKWADLCKPKCAGGMGFRNLIAFNKALLAKQVWRIIQEPTSLMARVLKGRYFKNHDIMDAGISSNPSYIWRSLIWSQELIRKGISWRVGNGQKILAHYDPWIPELLDVKSPFNSALNNSILVAQYISDVGLWNEHEVRQNFPIHAAEAILNIPLNRRGCEDIRYWKGSKDGKYTVKTGYLLEIDSTAPPLFQSLHPYQSWWKVVWKLWIPPKVRIFLRRASWNIIPSSMNLLAHHVPVSAICALCKKDFATTGHALLYCSEVRRVWKRSLFWNEMKTYRTTPFIEITLNLYNKFRLEEFELFVIMCWAVWAEYCKRMHATVRNKYEINVDWVYALLDAYRKACVSCSMSTDGRLTSDCVWKPPDSNHIRLNVDASCDLVGNKFSVGAIARDSQGNVKGASACVIRDPGSVVGAELFAIRFGMELCLRLGQFNICIFSDSIQAINSIKKAAEDRGPCGVIALEIQAIFNSGALIDIHHIRRSANQVAHTLAHKAFEFPLIVEWSSGDLPCWLSSLVSKDFGN